MYKVKPFESFDLSDVKLPDTMYKMSPIYDKTFMINKQIGDQPALTSQIGDQSALTSHATVDRSLDEQTNKLTKLSLSDVPKVELVLQLACTSALIDFLAQLKSELTDQLNIRIFKHSSLSNEDESVQKWYSLTSSNQIATYNLLIILKPSDFESACLFKSDCNFKLNGEIKMISLLNGLISSSMSIQVDDLASLVHKLLLDEYLDYLQQSLNTKQVDQNKIQYYQNNLQIKSKVLELAEFIFRNQMKS